MRAAACSWRGTGRSNTGETLIPALSARARRKVRRWTCSAQVPIHRHMGAFRGPAGTTAVVLQPSYLPWRGYFDLVDRADVFVFYDDVQYDKHGWRNRNRVKTANGPAWITVPVHAHGAVERGTPICEIAIDHRRDWVRAHLETLRHAYGRQPFYARYAPLLAAILEKRHARLADLTIELTVAVARELGSATRFVR